MVSSSGRDSAVRFLLLFSYFPLYYTIYECWSPFSVERQLFLRSFGTLFKLLIKVIWIAKFEYYCIFSQAIKHHTRRYPLGVLHLHSSFQFFSVLLADLTILIFSTNRWNPATFLDEYISRFNPSSFFFYGGPWECWLRILLPINIYILVF